MTDTGVKGLDTIDDLEADREGAHRLLGECAAKVHTNNVWRAQHTGAK